MSDEDALLAGIAADPTAALPRLVYADYLDDRGEAGRAKLVRLEVQVAADPADDTALARFRDLTAGVEAAWLARFVRPEVARCGLRFDFACPKSWDDMEAMADDDPTARFCGDCNQIVTLSLSRAEASRLARTGQCVAVDRRLIDPAELRLADGGRVLIAGAIIRDPPLPPLNAPAATVGTFATADDHRSGLVARLGWLIRRRQR